MKRLVNILGVIACSLGSYYELNFGNRILGFAFVTLLIYNILCLLKSTEKNKHHL